MNINIRIILKKESIKAKLTYYLENISIDMGKMYQLFMDCPKDMEAEQFIQDHGPLILRHACHKKHIAMVQLMMDKKIHPLKSTHETYLFDSPATIALHNLGIVKILFSHGAYDLENLKRSDLKEIPFLKAIEGGNQSVVEFFLEKGQDINVIDPTNFYNGFIVALLHNQNKIAQFLIDKGIDLNIQDKYGNYPITLAIRTNKFSIVQYMLDNKSELLSEFKKQIKEKEMHFNNDSFTYAMECLKTISFLEKKHQLEMALSPEQNFTKKIKI